MKNKTFIDSIICAFRGLYYAIRSEKNFLYYIIIDLIFLIVNVWLGVSTYIWILYILSSFTVYAMECVNTSIEHICDMLSKEEHIEIKRIKDMAAAAVLVCGLGFFAVEIAAFIMFF